MATTHAPPTLSVELPATGTNKRPLSHILPVTSTSSHSKPSTSTSSSSTRTSTPPAHFAPPPTTTTTTDHISHFPATRRAPLLTLLRLALISLTIGTSAGVLACTAHIVGFLRSTKVRDDSWEGVVPGLWPVGMEDSAVKALMVGGAVGLCAGVVALLVGVLPIVSSPSFTFLFGVLWFLFLTVSR